MPTLITLGMIGAGKSNLCSWLIQNRELFKVSDGVESCTQETVLAAGPCFGHYGGYRGHWRLVDTIGLCDSAGRDAQNLKKMISFQKEVVLQANAFILVVNAQEDRISAALEKTIHVFRACFGLPFWSNLCIIFTRWDWGKKLGGFDTEKFNRRRHEWQAKLVQWEKDYSQRTVDLADVQFFAVELPNLNRVFKELGDNAKGYIEDTLKTTSPSGLATTGEHLRAFYNHVFNTLATRPVSLLHAEAHTESLPDEVKKRLAEEQEKLADETKRREALQQQLLRQKEREAAEQKRQEELQKRIAAEEAKKKEALARQAALEQELQRQAAERKALEDEQRRKAEAEAEMRRRVEQERKEAEAAEARRREEEENLRRQVHVLQQTPPPPPAKKKNIIQKAARETKRLFRF